MGEVNAALNMSDKQFKAKYNHTKPDYSDEIIFHCRIGRRSENAAINATKLGYTKYDKQIKLLFDFHALKIKNLFLLIF